MSIAPPIQGPTLSPMQGPVAPTKSGVTSDPAQMAINRANLTQSINDPNGAVAKMGGGQVTNTTGAVTPTVISDTNIRDKAIPETVSKFNNIVNPPKTGTTNPDGSNPNGSTGDTGTKSYEDYFNDSLKGSTSQPIDPTAQAEMDLIDNMKKSGDAVTASSVSAIQDQYKMRQQLLQKTQNSGTAMLKAALNNAGGRYTPGDTVSVLSDKEKSDLHDLNDLQTQENSAIAQVQQAQSDKDYKGMQDKLTILEGLRKEKIDKATNVANAMTKKNQDDRDYNLKLEEFNQKAAQDKEVNKREQEKIEQDKYEFRDLKDDMGNTIGTQVIDKTTGKPISAISQPGNPNAAPGSNGPLNAVGLDANGNVDTGAQKAFLDTLPPPISALVSGLINYTAKPPSNSKAGQKLNALAHQADPTYDESQYNIRQKMTLDYTSGQTGKNITALNTSVNHLVDLSKNFASLPNGDLTKFNTIKDWYNANVGKGDVTKVITDLNAVTGELAKVFKGTGATDEEISNIKAGISLNSSPTQFKAFIEEATSLLGGRLDALNQTYANAVGKDFPRSFLTPETAQKLSTLKDQGYNIDVKGAKFTDADAYLKASPENVQTFKATAARLEQEFPGRKFDHQEIMQAVNSNE